MHDLDARIPPQSRALAQSCRTDVLFGQDKELGKSIRRNVIETRRVTEVDSEQLRQLDVLVVGAPTHGFQPSPAARKFLKGILTGALKGVRVAVFDTRVSEEDVVRVSSASSSGSSATPPSRSRRCWRA